MDEIDLLFKLDIDVEELLNALRCWLLEPLGVKDGMCYELFCDVCPAREVCSAWVKAVVNKVCGAWNRLLDEMGWGRGGESHE